MSFIFDLPQFHIIQNDLKSGHSVQVEGCVASQQEHMLSVLVRDYDLAVVIAQDEVKASEVLRNYQAFDKDAYYYPAADPMFFKADIQGSYLQEQRSQVLKHIMEGKKAVIVTTLDAFFERLNPMDVVKRELIKISVGDTLDEHELADKLVALGYSNETLVAGHGEFSIRGSIIDVFPYASAAPYRVDLFGDEVESIRMFDVDSQRSVETVESIRIYPGTDGMTASTEETNKEHEEPNVATWKEECSFLGYFSGRAVLFCLLEPVRILKEIMGMNPLQASNEADIPEHLSAERIKLASHVIKTLSAKTCLIYSSLGEQLEQVEKFRRVALNVRNIPSYNGRFLDLVEDLKKYRKNGYTVLLECANEVRKEHMVRNLAENGVTVGKIEGDPAHKVLGSDIQVHVGSVRVGFEYPDVKYSLISEVDIFGAKRARRKKKKYTGDPLKEFSDLNIGDYVVHEQHGVGIYQGIERMKVDGIEKDYMKIGYANNACLFVLATQFDKIQKYGGSEDAKPKLNKLGGKEWENTKAKVRTAVQDIAQDLVRLYAARQMQNGYRYSKDTTWQREFEDDFEYEETDDQLKAIEDIKCDMESGRIMDRLVCGDVGFGKTEVAIRAAFKAVQDDKQVALLAPTTILAQQHYNTMKKRMENYPVNIRIMSRFAPAKEVNAAIKGLASGKVDIVVGTHRILSKDVEFKDLGLLIIDEEQRFGVAHKEKIKQLRKNVDVLTLSATPIPRTLHMSLTGIRDMSILTEPPVDRIPIQTYVMEYSDEAVKEAILRETNRGGQVYYVYNRTGNIDMVADKLQQMLPHLKIEFAHGRMSARELERIMQDFIEGNIDVLVSTTIIETGLDISNVNTIIIHDADRFGLSQLYQLRGRVGRSNRTAYAFLMYQKDKLIKEVAEKRLKAIREFSDLGSGIKIAMRDLEIRGAGNVLGAEQSGHMEAVGYELYCKMLNQAVALLKGEKPQEDFETTVDLDVDGFIPATYIVNEYEKLNMYKKISAISDLEEMAEIKEELKDRFGELPRVTDNLLTVAFIKSQAHAAYVTEISNSRQGIVSRTPGAKENKDRRAFKISILKDAPIDTYKMLGIIREHEEELRFIPDKDPYFIYSPLKTPKNLLEINKTLLVFFDILKAMIDTGDGSENEL